MSAAERRRNANFDQDSNPLIPLGPSNLKKGLNKGLGLEPPKKRTKSLDSQHLTTAQQTPEYSNKEYYNNMYNRLQK